ncbi:ribulose-phosphate 3-epimerase [Enterococcus hirae]|jgi:ribulose-phosphate 3-epimerase|nr:ribulose-phosphate 3-epimerase [Enterococcaceae bacterium]MCI1919645.1 ribulose-phosphate 3-epimerase [Enterococcaceae bacterium]MDM8212534.1 ribulose-phosphate 3-epimerase [Enterococcus hirae]
MKIAPSILSADFAHLARDIEMVEKFGADWIHVDVMDGRFVDNLTFGPLIVKAIRPVTNLPLDVHMMVERPEQWIPQFAKAGADYITIHVEATPHIHGALQQIKSFGVKSGVVINPGTPVALIREVLPLCDLVLVMSVNPGFGGQKFLPEVVHKIEELAAYRQEERADFLIEVDGGLNEETAPIVVKAGADVCVAGSYIYGAEDPKARIAALRASAR